MTRKISTTVALCFCVGPERCKCENHWFGEILTAVFLSTGSDKEKAHFCCRSKIQLWFTSYTLSLVSILSDKANKVRAFFKILCWAINILLFLSDRSCIFYYF